MKKLVPNREFVLRHLGVALLMLGLAGWFGYDGYINYPRQDESYFAERHLKKANAIQRQKEFMILALLASLLIAGHVGLVARFSFSWDEEAFVCRGVRRRFDEIGRVDWSRWEKKDIVRIDGIVLDAWHHVGVREVVELLISRGRGPKAAEGETPA